MSITITFTLNIRFHFIVNILAPTYILGTSHRQCLATIGATFLFKGFPSVAPSRVARAFPRGLKQVKASSHITQYPLLRAVQSALHLFPWQTPLQKSTIQIPLNTIEYH